MYYYLVAPTTRAHSHGYFTYHSTEPLKKGLLVAVEIGSRRSAAVIMAKTTKPSFTTKPIIAVIENPPLPAPLLTTAKWLEEYYSAPISNVWQTVLPRGLEKKRRNTDATASLPYRKKNDFKLNHWQKKAVTTILRSSRTTTLLQGVTGSGKTAVYIELAKKTIENGKSVIVLVPEISLTPQLVDEFSHHFKNILLTHSRLTEAKRHTVWQKALHATSPQIVIGPRSALFSPLQSVGLIIIDEAHEPSLKQEQAPRYSALRAASILAAKHKAKLVLGSATPSIVDKYLSEHIAKSTVYLPETARKPGKTHIKRIDSREKSLFTKHRFFSNDLIEAVEQALHKKEQVMLFHNRRGTAPTTLCENCGWSAMCQRCFIPQVLHSDSFNLQCHVCGIKEKVPTACPDCQRTNIIHKGIGTKLVFDEISKLFPKAKVARFDSDSSAGERLETQYKAVYDGEIDIIVGTQTIAKGLDLPRLSTVGIIQAESGLSLPDFSSEERVFQLLYQVIGRVGRDSKLSKIIVQSYRLDHPAIEKAFSKDYEGFYSYALAKRKKAPFPPFTYLLKLTCHYSTEKSAMQAARKLKQRLEDIASPSVTFLGPTPAFYEKAGGQYRWQIIARSPVRESLKALLSEVPAAKWQTELDPVSLL